MVFITFSLAHEDSKKMEKAHTGINSTAFSQLTISGKQLPEVLPGQPSFITE
jgi:hypothetical protein